MPDRPFTRARAQTLLARLAPAEREPVRVLVVDDDWVFALSLSILLAFDERLDVVGRAGNGLDAVEMAKRLRPDVVVMDLELPRMDGIEATRAIRASLPRTQVIVLTGSEDVRMVGRALAAGALRFFTKREPLEALPDAVLDVASQPIPMRAEAAERGRDRDDRVA